MSGLMNKETAQSQVAHSVLWSEEILINHLLRLNKFILENEFAHFRKRLTFATGISQNLLQNTKVHFMSIYKRSFTIYGILCAIFFFFLIIFTAFPISITNGYYVISNQSKMSFPMLMSFIKRNKAS